MDSVKMALIGGFLGAGKTTLMLALGRRLVERDRSVALITNDQGEALVDTRFARAEGFETSEVLGGCFCCRFPDLMKSIEAAVEAGPPDVILAEPVGSCTDLAATVHAPLRHYHGDTVALAPMLVLVDTTRLLAEDEAEALADPTSPKEVLLAHQVREAQVLLLSKVDLVDEGELARAAQIAARLNPAARVLAVSAETGQGVDEVVRIVEDDVARPAATVPIDYDVYAEAEAAFGWYNGSWRLTGAEGRGFRAADVARAMMRSFAGPGFDAEVAHAKLFVAGNACSLKLSLVGETLRADGLCSTTEPSTEAFVTLNVRALTTPGAIARHVEDKLHCLAEGLGLELHDYEARALVPGRPEPTHRMTDGD